MIIIDFMTILAVREREKEKEYVFISVARNRNVMSIKNNRGVKASPFLSRKSFSSMKT